MIGKRWVQEWRATGRTAPKPRSGDRRSDRVAAESGFLLANIEERPDITLAELRGELRRERALCVAISTLWRFFDRRGVTFKKRRHTQASRTVWT